MADLIAVSALTFTAAYLVLRNRPDASARVQKTSKALRNTEQVLTTNIHTRMGDAIGTGAELGLSRAQMGATMRDAEADIHLSGQLKPTAPASMLPIMSTTSLKHGASGRAWGPSARASHHRRVCAERSRC